MRFRSFFSSAAWVYFIKIREALVKSDHLPNFQVSKSDKKKLQGGEQGNTKSLGQTDATSMAWKTRFYVVFFSWLFFPPWMKNMRKSGLGIKNPLFGSGWKFRKFLKNHHLVVFVAFYSMPFSDDHPTIETEVLSMSPSATVAISSPNNKKGFVPSFHLFSIICSTNQPEDPSTNLVAVSYVSSIPARESSPSGRASARLRRCL